jgi:hypothetical protein
MWRSGEMKTEGIIALIAGILGLIGSVFMLFLSAFMDDIAGKAVLSMVFGALAIVSAIQSKKNSKNAGVLMIIAAIGGFFTSSVFFIVSTILLVISGTMCMRKVRMIETHKQTP